MLTPSIGDNNRYIGGHASYSIVLSVPKAVPNMLFFWLEFCCANG
ncbi:hypothetical protein AALB_0119 [Agarivorans albus MKT 106]|uniref:Uncharacterized protein n=1 Tax=Agarivorans albus MKT 106 TaxID=1331007 RepID=R9PF81_AGAAL|nr:hypothetical protein AALB_0119 [Agarivorans albus MKT 106]